MDKGLNLKENQATACGESLSYCHVERRRNISALLIC